MFSGLSTATALVRLTRRMFLDLSAASLCETG